MCHLNLDAWLTFAREVLATILPLPPAFQHHANNSHCANAHTSDDTKQPKLGLDVGGTPHRGKQSAYHHPLHHGWKSMMQIIHFRSKPFIRLKTPCQSPRLVLASPRSGLLVDSATKRPSQIAAGGLTMHTCINILVKAEPPIIMAFLQLTCKKHARTGVSSSLTRRRRCCKTVCFRPIRTDPSSQLSASSLLRFFFARSKQF